MGCVSSTTRDDPGVGNSKGQGAGNRANPVPIPPQRQEEAKQHFGLTQHNVIRPLGVGGTGETYLCRRVGTNQDEAVKVIRRPIPPSLQTLITNEVILQASLGEGHVNLVNAHEVLLTESHLCLFMEYIPGGTLTDYVSARCDSVDERGGLFLSEDEARYLFQQCIEAVDYCHQRDVAHRDLKLDNTLLDGADPPAIKICDFGFAKLMGNNNLMTNIGTPVYMAPQQIKKGRDGYDGRAADVWACGVLLFVMLLGAFPFEHSAASAADEQRAFNEVHFEQIRIHWTENERNKEVVKRMSHDCVDLLDRIFQIKEGARIKIEEIKQHPWYTEPLSPKYDAAMRRLRQEQLQLDTEMRLLKESGGLSSKQDVIKDLVARACSKSPNPSTQSLEGQGVSLMRIRGRDKVLASPGIPEGTAIPENAEMVTEVAPADVQLAV